MNYTDKLLNAVRTNESVLCVGLDPNPDLIPESLKKDYPEPEELVVEFCREVIDSVSEHCCAYKPNLAFFEALGANGLNVFEEVLAAIPDEKLVIADAKRGDIGSTAEQYKRAFFDRFDVDAITLNPLMGFDTFDPFMNNTEKAVYSLVLTSNSGANDLLLRRFEGRLSLAEYLADQLRRKMDKSRTHIGMVVGATYPSELQLVLNANTEAALLIPGIGSQGGKIDSLVDILAQHEGIPLISSSRSIIYAGEDSKKWKKKIEKSAKNTKKELNKITRKYV